MHALAASEVTPVAQAVFLIGFIVFDEHIIHLHHLPQGQNGREVFSDKPAGGERHVNGKDKRRG